MSAEGRAETAPFGFRVACARVLGCVQLDKLRRHGTPDSDGTDGADDTAGAGAPADTSRAWEAIEQAVIGKTIIFLLHS
jgi:hypothetical protein